MAEKNLKVKRTLSTPKNAKPKVEKKAPSKQSALKPAKVAENVKPLQFAVGRRKRAVARVRMFRGKGQVLINEKPVEEIISSKADLNDFLKPMVISGVIDTHDFTVKVLGGGSRGRLIAAKHGIARTIAKINDDMKKTMKQGGFLTRDPREKERKKIYHVRARKSPQYSKR